MVEDDDKVVKIRDINAGGTQNITDAYRNLDCKMTYYTMASGLQGLQATECVWPDEVGR